MASSVSQDGFGAHSSLTDVSFRLKVPLLSVSDSVVTVPAYEETKRLVADVNEAAPSKIPAILCSMSSRESKVNTR